MVSKSKKKHQLTDTDVARIANVQAIRVLHAAQPLWTHDRIAAAVGCSKSLVGPALKHLHLKPREVLSSERWRSRKAKRAVETVAAKKLRERRELVAALAEKVLESPGGRRTPLHPSPNAVGAALEEGHKIKVSRKTVENDLKRLGFRCRIRPLKPHYARDVKNLEQRKQFVNDRRWMNKKKVAKAKANSIFKRILFSDEHTVSVNDHGNRTMWVRDGKKLLPRERKNPQNAMQMKIWAFVGYGVKSELHFWLGNTPLKKKKKNDDDDGSTGITAAAYNPMIDMSLEPRERWQAWVDTVKRAWASIPQEKINSIVLHFAAKLEEVREREGAQTAVPEPPEE